jgi:tRNA A22 N-methylase
MTLYEPVSLTFALISVLIFGVGGTLFDSLLTKHERDCQANNSLLQQEQREGPLRPCRGGG